MSIALSVVIPTYQRWESLHQVLEVCFSQSLASGRYEVIVSIDGSTDETSAMLAQLHPPCRLRWTSIPHSGAAAARTEGARLARGDTVLFIDDDVIPAPNLLAEHLDIHRGSTKLVGLGRVQHVAGESFSDWERYLCERYQEHYQKLAESTYHPCFWDCLAGNLSIPRQLLLQCGYFDRTLDRHEDTELGYRLSRAGARFVYLPRALGYHRFARSVDGGLRDAFREGKSARQLAQRHCELAPNLIHARWERYPIPVRRWMRRAFAEQRRHTRLAGIARVLVKGINPMPIPFGTKKLFYRFAFHLHFWLGVRSAGHATRLAPAAPSGAATVHQHARREMAGSCS